VNPRSTPKPVFGDHLVDQVAAFGLDAWSSRASPATRPQPREPVAMPPIDGRGLYQLQRVPPPRPDASQDQPEQAVSRAKAPIRTSENAQLVTKGEDFKQKVSPCRGRERDRGDGLHGATLRA
jgi:hypothetical protein